MTQQPQLCIFITTKKPETSLIMAAYQYIFLYSVGGWGEFRVCAAQATWPAQPMICAMCKVSRGRGYTTQPRKSTSVS